MINFRTLTLDQLIALLNETGYESTPQEFEVARDNNCFKYLGCSNGAARYLVGFEDDCADDDNAPYFVTSIYVSIGHDKLEADYSGMPEFHAGTVEEIEAYIEKKCN
jgi:hypothetical protein